MKTKDLMEKRGRLVADMRQLTEAPSGEGGDLSHRTRPTKFDTMKAELTAIEKQVDRQRHLDEAERRMNGETIAGSGDGRLDNELRNFSLRKAILSQMPGHDEDCAGNANSARRIARRSGRTVPGHRRSDVGIS